MISFSAVETRRLRFLAQGLDAPDRARSGSDVADIVRLSGGIQAQDSVAAAYQIRARSSGLTVAHVRRALDDDRSIVRTWVMRGTLHLIPSEEQRWMTALLGPPAFAAGRGRRQQLNLDEATLDRALALAVATLTDEGPLTRPQLAERLSAHGIPVAGQSLHHIVRSGGFLGVLCHGPLRDNHTETFVAADAWLRDVKRSELSRSEALARFARRYISAFGPATPRDFSAWAGLPLRDTNAAWEAIADELEDVTMDGEPAWIVRAARARLEQIYGDTAPIVRLLGSFDTYLLGYKGRDRVVAPQHASRVNAGGGMIRPVVTIDGAAVARWSLTRRSGGRAAEIAIEAFAGMEDVLATHHVRGALEREATDIGRFLGLESHLTALVA